MSDRRDLDLAVVGMALRVPGADSPEAFWHNLCQGVESIQRFPLSDIDGPTEGDDFVAAGSVLDAIGDFDAGFFGISGREAALMDPQQRIFLELCWRALEHAGCNPDTAGPVGVWAGAGINSYLLHNIVPSRGRFLVSPARNEVVLGNDKDFLATRVAYRLDLRGPAVTVQTACSTSLTAVHQASHALLDFQCDVALAGGVTVLVPQKTGYRAPEGGVFSPDGHCRPFDAQAAGTVFGSGAGVVVLKRLGDALDHGDTIYAVLRGSASNNDGADKVGFSAPSVAGQAAVVASALALAEVDPATLGYVEAHGTGTQLGDPIEVAALNQAFGGSALPRQSCALGSVKSNVGHLDAASGVVGLIKATLAVHHGQIPPSLGFKTPNPHLDLDAGPFVVNTALRPWPAGDTPRRAGVSSFGMGGTNVHVVLEQAPEPVVETEAKDPSTPELVVLSARTPAALAEATENLASTLRDTPEASTSQNLAPADFPDVAWTLQTGRRGFAHRCAWVARDREHLLSQLDAGRAVRGQAGDTPPPVVFLFPGQGAQRLGMGRQLYHHLPVFRQTVDQACETLTPHLGKDLRQVLWSPKTDRATLDRTALAQPALFVVEVALAQQWRAWGVEPAALLGHSLGEWVAACLAGVLSLDDALALVAERGRQMQAAPGGSMLGVDTDAKTLQRHLDTSALPEIAATEVTIAALNAPQRTVVSGPTDVLDILVSTLEAAGLRSRKLHTSHGFHSPAFDGMVEPFRQVVAQHALNAPSLPMVSNLTGDWLQAEAATDPATWARQLRQPVRFAEGLKTAAGLGGPGAPAPIFLEIGPGRGLTALAELTVDDRAGLLVGGFDTPKDGLADPEGTAEVEAVLRGLAQLWSVGIPVRWSAVTGDRPRRRVALPTYPFQRRRYWIDPEPATSEPAASRPTTPSSQPLPHRASAPEATPPVQGSVASHPIPLQGSPGDLNAALERTIGQQLTLMNAQLDLLRGPASATDGSGTSPMTSPARSSHG